MQPVDQQVLTAVRDWLAAGQPCWLCTIVATYGSSPRPVGSLMACNAGGEVVGSLSGGCVEDDLIEKLVSGERINAVPELLKYGIKAEDTEKLGLPCGGHLHIVVEPLQPAHAELFSTIVSALEQRQCITRHVSLNATHPMQADLAEGFEPLRIETTDKATTLHHTYGPSFQLFIIGAGMVSKYLAEMAQALNYDVTVCDPREAMLAQWAVPGVRTLCEMPDDAVRAHADDPLSAIVALTHDPRIDDMGLMEALQTRAFYVGAMGSERTSASRRARLKALDVSAAQLERLHAPIGLPIGSKTPPEIAIAILAELTAERAAARQRQTPTDAPTEAVSL